MYGLYGWLLAKGQVAHLNAEMDLPFIGVYPEIYHGNHAQAQTVVRYILNKPGFMQTGGKAGPTEFQPSDKIYVFSKIYDTFNSFEDKIMFLPILNLNLFKDQKRKRTKRCVYVGKGVDIDTPETKDLVRIDSKISLDQAGLADFLNECEIMYSYENPTAMVEIARLCGCKVVFFPEGSLTTYTKDELTNLYEPGMDGVGWDEPIDFNPEKFREHYKNLIKEFSLKLDKFIDDTQKD